MSLLPLVGHSEARSQVLGAIQARRMPQTLMLTGPRGVGKQRFGLWVAQALLCEDPLAAPCGRCRGCAQVLGLAHPDLHWLVPVNRPKAGEADRQVEELADLQVEALEERRRQPLWRSADGLAGHFVSTTRWLQRRAAMTPMVGPRQVFLIAQADRLVPQEASPEAANALLKLLEEPPGSVQFLLTVVDPGQLLPTIRSRLVPLRLSRLADSEVTGFLRAHAGVPESDLEERVRLAGGSIGDALATVADRSESAHAAQEILRVATSGTAARAERSLRQGPWAARGDFTAMLDDLGAVLSEAARQASGAEPKNRLPEALTRGQSVTALVEAGRRVAVARDRAQGNINPQLLLAVLTDELAEVL